MAKPPLCRTEKVCFGIEVNQSWTCNFTNDERHFSLRDLLRRSAPNFGAWKSAVKFFRHCYRCCFWRVGFYRFCCGVFKKMPQRRLRPSVLRLLDVTCTQEETRRSATAQIARVVPHKPYIAKN